jgi:predicted Zn-dependent peptidase
MAEESLSSRMYHIARQELQLGAQTSTERQLELVLAVRHEQVVDSLRTLLRPECFSLAVRGPVEGERVSEADWPVQSSPPAAAAG